MREIDIVYLYEHAARELDVACAVTARLRRDHDLSVEIIHWPHGFADAVARVQPKLVVLPFCYQERSYTNLLHFWYKVIFFNLTWEQLFYQGNRKAKTPRGEFALQHVIHHAWSNEYADFLKLQGIRSDYILMNGQPAYALYDEPYRRYFVTRETLASRYGLDVNKRWIFFPENYNWAFYSEATLRRFIESGQAAEDVSEMREFCNRSLAEVLRWCGSAAQDAGVELILRPRPSTTLDAFRAAVERVLQILPAGLHILQQESVREWILASDVVVSSHSTSLIEAAIAGKHTYILEPYPIPTLLEAEWHKYVRRIKIEQEFLAICQDVALGRSDDRLEHWARQSLMSQGDAIQNIAIYLNKLVTGETAAPPFYLKRDFLTPAKKVMPKRLWAMYRQVEGKSKPIAAEYVKDVLEPATLQDRIAKWDGVLA